MREHIYEADASVARGFFGTAEDARAGDHELRGTSQHVAATGDGRQPPMLSATQMYADPRMQAHVDRAFTYHPPQPGQAERYKAITRGTQELAQMYIDLAPPSAELTLALRDLESARMRVNQAIAVNEA